MKELKKLINKLIAKVDLCYNIDINKRRKSNKMKNNNQIDIFDVAQYLIQNQNKEDYTKMKLQKLVF